MIAGKTSRIQKANGSEQRVFIFTTLAPALPTVVYDTYWRFATERQNLFFRRATGADKPWTDDSILQTYKFTNAYRAADRVSQYLIRNVQYRGSQEPNELFFRTILFKLFNKIETWELFEQELGTIECDTYTYERYDKILSRALQNEIRIYSAAYIMPSGARAFKTKRKHQAHLKLLESMLRDELPKKIVDAPSMRDVFHLLVDYPMIGEFLAYQFATDINYSVLTDFSESMFVIPGPGAIDGIHKCFSSFGGLTEADIIKVVMDRQELDCDRLGLQFKTLWGRPLQLIDCQNLFCEISKYARVRHPNVLGKSGRTRIKQKYRTNPKPIEYWFPPKWEINDRIQVSGSE